MHQHFLSAYQQVNNLTQPTTGVWLLHGDEKLLSQWFIEKLQPHWLNHGLSILRMDIVNAKSWQDILIELNSLSLFDDNKVIIAQGNHKPDKESLLLFSEFIKQNSTNCLVIISDKYDKKSQNSTFFQLCERFGQVIDCQIYQEYQREKLLKHQAEEFGLQLTDSAWQLLLDHTQNNLLTAYQTLWRLSYLYSPNLSPTTIHDDQLQDGLVSQSQFTTFDLSNAMLSGNLSQVAKILQHLKRVEEPESLVLWVIANDMRTLQSLQAGNSYQKLGIWQAKQDLYQQALQRHANHDISQWSNLLYRCDQAVKGLIKQPAWELLYQSAFILAGSAIFKQF